MTVSIVDNHAVGQCELDKILASDGTTDDRFGYAVSISNSPGGEVAIVGAFWDSDIGALSGSAYIYRFNGVSWAEEQKLTASDGVSGERFGVSVSISGAPGNEVAIIGANLDDDNGQFSGSAYIFRFNGVTWVEEQKLLASDGMGFERFGRSVSISVTPGNEVAIIGAPEDDDNGFFSGSAYIFRYDPAAPIVWFEETKILASDGAVEDVFGWSVSISSDAGNDVAIVGAYADDDDGASSGSAYIYRNSVPGGAWAENKITASDAAAGDLFGESVSISGSFENEIVIVGANLDDDNGLDSGSAYIFRNIAGDPIAWSDETKLLASNGAAGDVFGKSVSISELSGTEFAIVGAWSGDGIVADSGSAYMYRFDGVNWVEEAELIASDGATDDLFGAAVSISGALAFVGANQDDDNGQNSGSTYVFEWTACVADTNCSGEVNVTDLLNLLAAWGSCPAPCPPDFNTDGNVNVTDLLALLAGWGVCP